MVAVGDVSEVAILEPVGVAFEGDQARAFQSVRHPGPPTLQDGSATFSFGSRESSHRRRYLLAITPTVVTRGSAEDYRVDDSTKHPLW